MSALSDLFDNLLRVEIRLFNGLDDRLRSAHGIVTAQLEVLRVVASVEGCRVQDVADHVAITVGAASKAVDRAEAQRWVRRRPHPDDRRSSILTLTAAGQRLHDRGLATFEAYLEESVGAPLSARDVATLARVLARLRTSLEATGVGDPA